MIKDVCFNNPGWSFFRAGWRVGRCDFVVISGEYKTVGAAGAPIASEWSEPSSRAGLSPAVDQRLFTAHALSRFCDNQEKGRSFSISLPLTLDSTCLLKRRAMQLSSLRLR